MASKPIQDRRLYAEDILRRLKTVMKKPHNQLCSECLEPKPTWAVLFEPATEGERKLGVLCCFKCSSHYFCLGKGVCTVKSAKMALEWTEVEVTILENSGNAIVNTMVEAYLDDRKGQIDLNSFVDTKRQGVVTEQTLRPVNRRAKDQLHKSHSVRNIGATATRPIAGERPSLQRMRSTRSCRSLNKDRPSLPRTKAENSQRIRRNLSVDFCQRKPDHLRPIHLSSGNKRSDRATSDDHLVAAVSDHHVRNPYGRTPSGERSHAMSNQARLSTRHLKPKKTMADTGRQSSTQDHDDLKAKSYHNPRTYSSRSRSCERIESASDHRPITRGRPTSSGRKESRRQATHAPFVVHVAKLSSDIVARLPLMDTPPSKVISAGSRAA